MTDVGPASHGREIVAVSVSAELGGTERVLLDFAQHAAHHRFRLQVVVPRPGPLVDALAGFDVPTHVIPAPAGLLRRSQRGAAIFTLPAALLGLWGWGRRLGRIPAVREADLVYTIGFKAHLAAWITGRGPRVWHLHEFPPRTTGGLWRVLSRRLATGLVANSRSVERAWSGHHRVAVATVLNGVDLARFRPAPRTGWIHRALDIPAERRLIGMPAVLARWKGHLEIIEAFGQVATEFPHVHLVFVGGAIYDTVSERRFGERLERAIRRAGDRVALLPFQADVERVYPELDLTVHYSLRPEPFGRIILESMACGTPVLAADEGGPREILGTPPSGGWLAPPRQPDALADRLRQALRLTEGDRAAVGAAARHRAEAAFSATRFADELSRFLHQVASDFSD